MTHDSILHQLQQSGMPAPRVQLPDAAGSGPQRSDATETRRYHLLGELARGAVGVVYQGRDNDLGRDVAIKVLHESHLKNGELLRRFIEEAQIGGQLQHPGVVPIYELGLQADDRPFFAMKLVKGETLARRLADRKGTSDQRRAILTVFREMCRTMSYVHSRSVIHRDLKPGNVMIGGFGEVQIVDWGFAKILAHGGVADEKLRKRAERNSTMIATARSQTSADASLVGSVMGTPAYMPPEQAMGRIDHLDERSDIFSLGAILCEILTGQPPYQGSTTTILKKAATADLADALQALDRCDGPAELVTLCRRCLQPIPKDRPGRAEELADVVAAWLTEVEGQAHRAELARVAAEAEAEASRRRRQNTRRLAVAAVLVVTIGIGTMVLIDSENAARERNRAAAVGEAMAEVGRLRAAGEWLSANAAVDRAGALGAKPDVLDELRRSVRDGAEAQRRDGEDRAFLSQLEQIRSAWDNRPTKGTGDGATIQVQDDAATDRAYAAAFEARFGNVDFSDATLDSLRRSRVAPAFAANVIFWAWLRKKDAQRDDWQQLAAFAARIDERHAALCTAMFADDPDALAAEVAASSGDVEPALASVVGLALAAVPEHREQARALFRKTLDAHPDDFWLHANFGKTALAERDLVTARRHLSAALALQPDRPLTWHSLASTYFDAEDKQARDADSARVLLRHAVELAPDRADVLTNVGGMLTNSGAPAEGEALLRRATEIDPEIVIGWQNLGITQIYLGKLEQGIAALRRAVELDPTQADSQAMIGFALLQDARYAEAEEELRRALEMDGEHETALVNLANALSRQRRRQESLEVIDRLLQRGLRSPAAGASIACTLALLGEDERAVQVVDRALAEAPVTGSLLGKAATVYSSVGNSAVAKRLSDQSLELEPENPVLHEIRLRVSIEAREFDIAAAEADRLLVRWPDEVRFAMFGGKAKMLLGDWAGARLLLERVFAEQPNDLEAAKLLAEVYERIGQREKAIPCYEHILAQDPRYPDVRVNLAAVLAACGRPAEGMALMREEIESDPTNGSAHGTLAAIAFHTGNRELARDELELAVRYVTDEMQRLLPIAELLKAMGDWHRAREMYRRALHVRNKLWEPPSLLVQLGGALSNQGDLRQAVEVLERAALAEPGSPFVHLYLGITLGKLDRRVEAARAFSRCFELTTDPQMQRSAAGGMFDNGDTDGARRAFEKLFGKIPQDNRVLRHLAMLDEVEPALRGERVDLPPSPRAHLAVHLDARGAAEAALRQFRIAFAEDPSLREAGIGVYTASAASAAAKAGGDETEQAIAWLHALVDQAEALRAGRPDFAISLLERILHAPSFASLRDPPELPPGAAELFARVRALRAELEQGSD